MAAEEEAWVYLDPANREQVHKASQCQLLRPMGLQLGKVLTSFTFEVFSDWRIGRVERVANGLLNGCVGALSPL